MGSRELDSFARRGDSWLRICTIPGEPGLPPCAASGAWPVPALLPRTIWGMAEGSVGPGGHTRMSLWGPACLCPEGNLSGPDFALGDIRPEAAALGLHSSDGIILATE